MNDESKGKIDTDCPSCIFRVFWIRGRPCAQELVSVRYFPMPFFAPESPSFLDAQSRKPWVLFLG